MFQLHDDDLEMFFKDGDFKPPTHRWGNCMGSVRGACRGVRGVCVGHARCRQRWLSGGRVAGVEMRNRINPSSLGESKRFAPLSLLAVGDWGGYDNMNPTTKNQVDVAAAMGAVAKETKPEAVLMLGDNFYDRGLSCDDELAAGYDYAEKEADNFAVVESSFDVVSTDSLAMLPLTPGHECNLSSVIAEDIRTHGYHIDRSNVRDLRRSYTTGFMRAEFNVVSWYGDGAARPTFLRKALAAALDSPSSALAASITCMVGTSTWRIPNASMQIGLAENRPCNQKFSSRFKTTFEDVYNAQSLSDVPFYVLSGNHDYYGWVRAQVAYANEPPPGASQRWRYPVVDARPSAGDGSVEAPWYSFEVQREDDGLSMLVVMMDTVKWAGLCTPQVVSHEFLSRYGATACVPKGSEPCLTNRTRTKRSVRNADGRTFTLCDCIKLPDGKHYIWPCAARTPEEIARARAHERWLNKTLAGATHDWIIVAGHYPVWSVAEHGPTPQLVEELRPYLFNFGVALYLNGHDHNAQHVMEARPASQIWKTCDYSMPEGEVQVTNSPDGFDDLFSADVMHYVTVGAGSLTEDEYQRTLQTSVPFFSARGSFAQLEVMDAFHAILRIFSYGTDGATPSELYQFAIRNSRRPSKSTEGRASVPELQHCIALGCSLFFTSLAVSVLQVLTCFAGQSRLLF